MHIPHNIIPQAGTVYLLLIGQTVGGLSIATYGVSLLSFLTTHMCVEPVGHEFKLAIWRNEGDCSVVLKARKPDALVEFNIFKFHGFTFAAP